MNDVEPLEEVNTEFLVIGSGGGGMLAAVAAAERGLKSMVVESASLYGGTTAMSGGALWVPNNHLMAEAGVGDSQDDAVTYLQHTLGDDFSETFINTYLDQAPELVRFLTDTLGIPMRSCTAYPDYYSDVAGARSGGRAVECLPLDGKQLGVEEFRNLRRPHPQELVLGRLSVTTEEAHSVLFGGLKEQSYIVKMLIGYMCDPAAVFRYGRSTRLTMGNALVAALRMEMIEREIPLWLNAPATKLVIEGERVVGAEVERDGKRVLVRASRGVLIAAGGFAAKDGLRKKHQRTPASADWTAASKDDRGDGISLGEGVNAQVKFLKDNWWTPTMLVPGEELAWLLVVEKGMPYSIMVNGNGERFVNEAAPYTDVVKGMYNDHVESGCTVPAYLIFDKNYRKLYPCGPVMPSIAMPDAVVPRRLKEGFLVKASTLDELATKLGIDGARLQATVEIHNGYAATGVDEDFYRGETASDQYYADPRVTPNPSLGPIGRPPFYAIRVWPGDLGTKGGLVTDKRARVLDTSGEVIEGLYASGNCAAHVMGGEYPGAGATIGPAMTFSFVAAKDVAS